MTIDNSTGSRDVFVLVWRENLLPLSETFVRDNTTSPYFRAKLAGMRKLPGQMRGGADFTFMESKLSRIFFRLSGFSRGLKAFITENGFTHIHAHFGWDGIWIFRLAKRLGLPLIVSMHGYDVLALNSRKSLRMASYKILARLVLPRADRILCTSEYVRERAIEAFALNPGKVFTHYLGSNTHQDPPLLTGRDGLLFVGRLIRGKGLMELLQALKLLLSKYPNPPLRVIGEGPEMSSLLEFAESNKLSVSFLGAQNHQTVMNEMSRAKLLIVPSTIRHGDPAEGLGMVAVEAMAAGLPVLAFDTGGLSEVVGCDSRDQLVLDGDIQGLADKIHELYYSESKLESFALAGLNRFNSNFRKDDRDRELLRHYIETRRPN